MFVLVTLSLVWFEICDIHNSNHLNSDLLNTFTILLIVSILCELNLKLQAFW